MKFKVLVLMGVLFSVLSADAAYQYNVKGNQGWLTFDSNTTVAFDLVPESQKNKDNGQENYIDRGKGIADYGWYNLDTKASGSFKDGASATFSESDRIGLWVKDNTGNVYVSTKPKKPIPDNVIWGKARVIEESMAVAGGNFGSNGTQEYYVFKVNANNSNGNTPSGQPLPGILAVLAVGGAAWGAKKLYDKKKVQK